MRWRRLGFLAALVAAFSAGTKTGIDYAKGHYVVKDKKFIEGEVVKSDKKR